LELGTLVACMAALYSYWNRDKLDKITIYHDPSIPLEMVGQETTIRVAKLIFDTLNIDFIENNPIKATVKHVIDYLSFGPNIQATKDTRFPLVIGVTR